MDISKMYCRVDSEHFDEFVRLVGELFGDSNADDVRRWYRYDNCDAVSAKGYVGDHSYYTEQGYTEFTGSWSVYSNTKPLSELTDEQAAELFNWWRNGGEIELFTASRDWVKSSPSWSDGMVYRAKQKSERDLFIEAAISAAIQPEAQTPKEMFGLLFDAEFKSPKGGE